MNLFSNKSYLSNVTVSAGGIIADHRGSARVVGVCHSNDEARHLQSRQITHGICVDGVWHDIELALCRIAEELQERIVHVAGWAGWVNTGDTVVEAVNVSGHNFVFLF